MEQENKNIMTHGYCQLYNIYHKIWAIIISEGTSTFIICVSLAAKPGIALGLS